MRKAVTFLSFSPKVKRKALLIALASGLFILFLYNLKNYIRLPFLEVNALEAIPNNSPVIFTFHDLAETQNKIGELAYRGDFEELYLVEKMNQDLGRLRRIFRNHYHGRQILEESRKVAALRISRSNDLDFLFVLDGYQTIDPGMEFLENLQNARIHSSNFRGQSVFTVNFADKSSFSLSFYKELIIGARYSFLVEEAIDQLMTVRSNICRDRGFRKADHRANKSSDVSIYLNFSSFPYLFNTFVKVDKRDHLADMEHYGSWLRLDASFTEKGIDASGILVPPKGENWFRALRHQGRGDHRKIMEILPDNVAILSWYSLQQLPAFLEVDLSQQSNNFRKYFAPWIGSEVATLMTEPYSSTLQAEKFLVFRAQDIALARHYLEKYSERVGQLSFYEYQTFPIRQIMATELNKPLLGKISGNPYYSIIGNYVIFANARSALEIWIDKYIAGQTLSRDINYLRFSTSMSAATGIFYFINTSNILQLLNTYTKETLQVSLKEQFNTYKKVSQLGFELNPQGGVFTINAHLQYSPEPQRSASIAWKTPLAGPAAETPKILLDPATQQYQILVQDTLHQLYLLDRNGEIQWQRQLQGPILSEIQQIDYNNNGRWYFIFNTPRKLYLIDRNGNDINSFPLNFLTEATNGISVVDFANRGEYAFYIACTNGNVYGFDRDGRPLSGWNPKADIGTVLEPVRHFQKGPNDYILIKNTEGRLYAFKRDGEPRFVTPAHPAPFLSPFDYQLSGSSSRVVDADAQGKVRVTNLSGESFQLFLEVGQQKAVQFCFADLTGDARKDYIGLSGRSLSGYYYEGNEFVKFLQYDFIHDQDRIFPVKLGDKDKSYIGTWSRSHRQISLLDENGMLFPDFPLVATTTFEVADLFQERKNTLVAANGKDIYAFRLR